ncbi:MULTISPECIES: tRNA (guanosine(46)-N7)-methyltransferase TrmB [Sporomusa]|uniref:tRNA (guanosine(46)-N7)-methyltransferase TrmB n=1 Tax=Sporomusa TaxID=2375 RepID=UPI002BB1BBBF|nr:tRNA (guanosine(46)-N7)-methyltransferase TrmB [Sporomusa sphaeroides]HML33936.1 tRNA (guanosine(46)-N7)-methyltransferase TrmB [Sporomusa sphaeroides]
MRLRKKPWIAEALTGFSDIVLPNPGETLQGKWLDLFGNRLPLQVELGTGKGRFITGMAEQQAQANFVGIEAQQDVLYYAAQKVQAKELANVRLLVFDVNNILTIFAPGEIDRLYINFCDPWPKNCHAKRRLTHIGFLEKYRTVLKPGGQLWFKTDNRPLFEFSLEQFAAFGLKVEQVTYDLHRSGFDGNVMTEYETKFSLLGQPICRCEVTFTPTK